MTYGTWTWTVVANEQFDGTWLFWGQSVDKNWLYFAEEGEDVELCVRVERLESLIGGNGVDTRKGSAWGRGGARLD